MTLKSLTFRWYWPRIKKALQHGDTERALRLANHYVRFYPRDPNSWMALSEALIDGGAYVEAEKFLREALNRQSSTHLRYLLVRVLILTRRLVDARQLLDAMAESDPASPLPYLGFADLAAFDENWEAVRDCAFQALERASPSYQWTEFEVARRLVDLPGQRSRAIELLTRFAEKMPKEALPHAMLAILVKDSDVARSQQHLAAARDLLGGNERLLNALLADVRWTMGEDVDEGPSSD